jgi:hypothetical protein
MAGSTRLNQLAETVAALKKSVERIEDNQRKTEETNMQRFDTITSKFKRNEAVNMQRFDTITSQFAMALKTHLIPNGGENVSIHVAPAKDKQPIQQDEPLVQTEGLAYQFQENSNGRFQHREELVSGSKYQDGRNSEFLFKQGPEPRVEGFHHYHSRIDAGYQRGEFSSRRRFLGDYHSRLHNFDDMHAGQEQNMEDFSGMNPRSVRIDFPRFDGNEPAEWLYRVEKYVEFYNTSYRQLLRLVSIHMEGKALMWYQDV